MSEPSPHLPTAFGPFTLLDVLAEGGMGAAFLASTQHPRQLVVVKRLLPQMMQHREAFQRFRHEAEVASHVRHPHVAELIAMGTVEGEPFLATEYVFGVALSEVVARVEADQISPLPVPVLLRLALDLVSGLRGVHEAVHRDTGDPLLLVHRDISARNVLLGSDGRLRIIDLGLGKSTLSDWRTGSHRVSGSPDYMAPEQAVGEPADVRSDVFAAAATLWELALGRKRITGGSVADRLERAALSVPVSMLPFRPDLPPGFDQALMRAMVNERHHRTPSSDALERDLQVAAESVVPASHGEVARWLDRSFATSLARSRRRVQAATSRLRDDGLAHASGAQYFFGSERVRERVSAASLFDAALRSRRYSPLLIMGAAGILLGLVLALVLRPPSSPRTVPVGASPANTSVDTAPPASVRAPLPAPDEAETSTMSGASAPIDTTEAADSAAARPATRAPVPMDLRRRQRGLARRLQRLRRLRYDRAFQRELTETGRAISRARSPAQLDRLEARIEGWERDYE